MQTTMLPQSARSTINQANGTFPRINQSDDSNIGSSDATNNSLFSMLSTLIPVGICSLLCFVGFLVIRHIYPSIYFPEISSPRQRRRWLRELFNLPDTYVLAHHSLDAFFFLRLLKMAAIICLVGCAITFPVLLPINATGAGGKTQLDILTIGNVKSQWKFFAHASVAWIFFGFIMIMITRESIFYINQRQAYLLSPHYANPRSLRTVLFMCVPKHYLHKVNIRHVYGASAKQIWYVTDVSSLEEKIKERDNKASKLSELIRACNAAQVEAKAKGDRWLLKGDTADDVRFDSAVRYPNRLMPSIENNVRLCRRELEAIVREVKNLQNEQKHERARKFNSVFIEFATVQEAQAAYKVPTHHHMMRMFPRFLGITPNTIIWPNLRLGWWQRALRKIAAMSAVFGLIVFWSIPSACISVISQISYLMRIFPWLAFVNRVPSLTLGVVTGLLPSILLSLLMSLLPLILRRLAKFSGDPSVSDVELTVQNTYFCFQVVQVFLVATLGSAASTVVVQIAKSPSSVFSILASSIPMASSFYLSYILLQGLGIASQMLLYLSSLAVLTPLGKLFNKPPSRIYAYWTKLSDVGWGAVFPIHTNLLVIAICYSCIAPLVLLFAALGFFLSYLSYRYIFLISKPGIDTKGRVYPRALQQLFVGIYIAEVCLIGLFAVATGESTSALGPMIMMIIFLAFTALFHIYLNDLLGPLTEFLPRSLESDEPRLFEMRNAREGSMARRSNSNLITEPNFLSKFLRPDIYADYQMLQDLIREMVESGHKPGTIKVDGTPVMEEMDYYHPSICSKTPDL